MSTNPDDEMTSEEVAKLMGEKPKKRKRKKEKDLFDMTKEELEAWEKSQDNSNDIYRVSARVKNLARESAGANLTPVGEALCNTYTHVLLSLYAFAETLKNKKTKMKLIELIRKHEEMPAQVISYGSKGASR